MTNNHNCSPGAERTRILPLAGGHNFRDQGGYPVGDGMRVAWRRIFRSGTLTYLTDDDHAQLESLGIRFICDLRTNRERRNHPSRWISEHDVEVWWRDHDASTADLAAAIAAAPRTVTARELMNDLYRSLPYDQSTAYTELLKRLASGQLPLLFHCSAGKDRTGVLGAILLDLLGVDRATVIADYVKSDDHYDRLLAMFLRDRHIHDIDSSDPERFAPLLRADPAYLQACFATIEQAHGSGEGYAREILGLSAGEITSIRERLVVPASGAR